MEWRVVRICFFHYFLVSDSFGEVRCGVVKGFGVGFGKRTRLLCWTDSGTRGLMSREISCFVGGIFCFSSFSLVLGLVWLVS